MLKWTRYELNLVDNWLLLTRGGHCLTKYELKSQLLVLILDINLLLWYIGGIYGTFLTIQ